MFSKTAAIRTTVSKESAKTAIAGILLTQALRGGSSDESPAIALTAFL